MSRSRRASGCTAGLGSTCEPRSPKTAPSDSVFGQLRRDTGITRPRTTERSRSRGGALSGMSCMLSVDRGSERAPIYVDFNYSGGAILRIKSPHTRASKISCLTPWRAPLLSFRGKGRRSADGQESVLATGGGRRRANRSRAACPFALPRRCGGQRDGLRTPDAGAPSPLTDPPSHRWPGHRRSRQHDVSRGLPRGQLDARRTADHLSRLLT